MKIEKWKEIAEKFNSTSTFIQRDWLVLRNLWENLKKKAKQTITTQNKNQFATGTFISNINQFVECSKCLNVSNVCFNAF